MSILFKGQSLFQIKLETGVNLAAVTEKKILYEKPDGTRGSWDATSTESNPTGTQNTIMVYQLEDGNVDQTGNWKFQSYILSSGKKGYGEVATEFIQSNLEAL